MSKKQEKEIFEKCRTIATTLVEPVTNSIGGTTHTWKEGGINLEVEDNTHLETPEIKVKLHVKSTCVFKAKTKNSVLSIAQFCRKRFPSDQIEQTYQMAKIYNS